MRFAFIAEKVAVFPIRVMCRVLGVSPSGYYAWRDRSKSARECDDEVLKTEIEAAHEQSRGTCGSPRITRELREQGRRVSKNDTELALAALDDAIANRKPPPRIIHHSDRGSPYASVRYRKRLDTCGMLASMSRAGDCWDNAVAESFFATIKGDELKHRWHPSHAAARAVIEDYITNFCNPLRRHSTLGYLSPDKFELRAQTYAKAA